MEKVYTVKEVREQVKAWRREGLTVDIFTKDMQA